MFKIGEFQMKESKFQEVMQDILETLANTNEIEVRKKYGKIINNLINSNYKLENMDNFNIMVNWELEKILSIVVTEINPAIIDMKNLEKLQFLYLNYTFMELNIEKLISKKEGSVCCADKTGHVLDKYRQYLLKGVIPKANTGTKNFWDFNFGTYEDWFEFCEGLYSLFMETQNDIF